MIILPAYIASFSKIKYRNSICDDIIENSKEIDSNQIRPIDNTTTILPSISYEMNQIISPKSALSNAYIPSSIFSFQSPIINNIINSRNISMHSQSAHIHDIRSVENNSISNVIRISNNDNIMIYKNISGLSAKIPFYGKRVLVVDDSIMTRKMLCRFIIDRCEFVDEADDGVVAVEMVKNCIKIKLTYDVILMDFQMPNKIGPIAAKEIRELGYTGLIVGITGNVLADDTSYFLSCGADKVLYKPIDMQQLDYTIKGIV
jgi:CheY-like chemotaxis protein